MSNPSSTIRRAPKRCASPIAWKPLFFPVWMRSGSGLSPAMSQPYTQCRPNSLRAPSLTLHSSPLNAWHTSTK